MQIDLRTQPMAEEGRHQVLVQAVQILRQYHHLLTPELVVMVGERTGREPAQIREVLKSAAAEAEHVRMPQMAMF